jgi:sulfatase maturation enzyme AslB (radical SAM superfamily)
METKSASKVKTEPTADAPSLQIRSTLNLKSKLYQQSIWSDVVKVSRGETLANPLVAELDLTSFCDLACPECISKALLNRSRFTHERMIEIAHELVEAGVRAVVLIGGGEPLLHSAFANVLRILGEAGVAVGVTTNGTLIDQHCDALSRYATWTRVSVDAGSPDTYEQFRPTRSGRNVFATVITNMSRLAKIKRGRLGYSYLLLARRSGSEHLIHNFNEVLQAAMLARAIGCDYFEVKPSYDMGHFLINQSAELRTILFAQLSSLASLVSEKFEILRPLNLDVILEGSSNHEPKEYQNCLVSELRTLITPTGLYVCPYHRGDARFRFGDLTIASLQEVWNGKARKDVMAKLEPSKHCQFHCIRHQSNQELIRLGTMAERPELVDDYDLFI